MTDYRSYVCAQLAQLQRLWPKHSSYIFKTAYMFRTQLSCMISHVFKQFFLINHSKLSGTMSLPTNGDGIQIG